MSLITLLLLRGLCLECGLSAPQIKPHGPLNLEPASPCFHYCPNIFQGLKLRLVRGNGMVLHPHCACLRSDEACIFPFAPALTRNPHPHSHTHTSHPRPRRARHAIAPELLMLVVDQFSRGIFHMSHNNPQPHCSFCHPVLFVPSSRAAALCSRAVHARFGSTGCCRAVGPSGPMRYF
jgi:hypothetical protein